MPGFRRSETTTQSLLCSEEGCSEKANDVCLGHMSTFCGPHFLAHNERAHRDRSSPDQAPQGATEAKAVGSAASQTSAAPEKS